VEHAALEPDAVRRQEGDARVLVGQALGVGGGGA
jgi:hypothetical protein